MAELDLEGASHSPCYLFQLHCVSVHSNQLIAYKNSDTHKRDVELCSQIDWTENNQLRKQMGILMQDFVVKPCFEALGNLAPIIAEAALQNIHAGRAHWTGITENLSGAHSTSGVFPMDDV